jgi:hypothetical protein
MFRRILATRIGESSVEASCLYPAPIRAAAAAACLLDQAILLID